jgi:glycosyltransferase involved in cell wall biosynthesis
MKLLVFAHTPPPHHGQSYMVQLMLEGFGGDHRKRKQKPAAARAAGDTYGIQCYHVNARLSKRLEDIGEFQGGKLLLLLLHCLEAVWCRFRYGVTTLYYIPAPGKKSALYRDWLVMFICRPFFKEIILHWHAAGLAKWLETSVLIRSRVMTYRLLKQADLSIVLSNCNIADAEKLLPKRVRIVGNGIPDPCPDFEKAVLPRHTARRAARATLAAGKKLTPADLENTGGDPHLFRVLFLAHCTREKGLFDTIEGVALASARLARIGSPLRIHLTVAGEFINAQERAEFERRIGQPDLHFPVEPVAPGAPLTQPCVTYAGFVNGAAKNRAFSECDCFCFPTYYHAESFGLVVLEAMAYGLPVITSRWRSLPELMPAGYPGLIAPRDPEQIAAALFALMTQETGEGLRESFSSRYTLERHLAGLAKAIASVEQPTAALSPAAATTPG